MGYRDRAMTPKCYCGLCDRDVPSNPDGTPRRHLQDIFHHTRDGRSRAGWRRDGPPCPGGRHQLQAITIYPEWVWAMVALGKRVENRPYPTPSTIVGEWTAIHAGAHLGGRKGEPAVWETLTAVGRMAARAGFNIESRIGDILAVRRSCIVALARFGEGVRNHPSPWSVPDQWQWPITEFKPLSSPVSIGGKQGLWFVPMEVERACFERARVTP